MVARIRRMAPLALASLALTLPASTARAQGNVFNPYGNSGYADYREFGNPTYATNPSLPGQARLNAEPIITRPRANSFQQYSEGLDGREIDGTTARGSSAGLPYYQAFRQYDKEFDRVYRPNAIADKGFDDRLRQRDQAYAKALKETDPAKRARMLRQIELDSLDRPAPNRARAVGDGPQAKGAPRTPAGSRAPAPTRRAPAPSAATARPVTPSPSSRAPSAPRTPAAPDPSTIAVPPPI